MGQAEVKRFYRLRYWLAHKLLGFRKCEQIVTYVGDCPEAAEKQKAVYEAKIKEIRASTPQPRRRIGLAEMRARREAESFKPVEHQAQVTQNNIAAMEGK